MEILEEEFEDALVKLDSNDDSTDDSWVDDSDYEDMDMDKDVDMEESEAVI